jgi:hypothetical protein
VDPSRVRREAGDGLRVRAAAAEELKHGATALGTIVDAGGRVGARTCVFRPESPGT